MVRIPTFIFPAAVMKESEQSHDNNIGPRPGCKNTPIAFNSSPMVWSVH